MKKDRATSETKPRTVRQRCWRWFKLASLGLISLILFYFLVVVVGLIPVNNDFIPAQEGIKIYVTSNPVHADVVVPIQTDVIDWRQEFPVGCFSGDTRGATHMAFGWGDKGFFIRTPTWSDLKMSTAANALLVPSDTCMHVVCTNERAIKKSSRAVSISRDQYKRLVDFIHASFRVDEHGKPQQIQGARYGDNDAFFESFGNYHCLNTCNSWVGRSLRTSGVRIAWLTPMPKSVYLLLPDEN